MQNRYAGDIGDYGKLGLLRTLRAAGLSIGVNWYLTPDEDHNDDGKHTNYLKNNLYKDCDEGLWIELKEIVDSKRRTVSSLEKESILDAIFYSERLNFSMLARSERNAFRNRWHKTAIESLARLDVAFVDPDNGLLVPSATETRKENKFVKLDELRDYYYGNGSSVIYYQHKARRPDRFYIDQNKELLKSFELAPTLGLGLKFKTTSLRYYFFIMQPQHKEIITASICKMLSGNWKKHFEVAGSAVHL